MALSTPYQNAAKYRQTQITTATRTHLIVMLYDGAIRFLSVALEQMGRKEIEPRHRSMLAAQRIIAELMGSLDMENGGEIAVNLQRLYIYMHRQLVFANRRGQPEPITRVIAQLRDLRESWAEIDRRQKLELALSGEDGG